MTREEKIIEQGISYTMRVCPACIGGDAFSDAMKEFNRNKAFEAGAKWADENINVESLWHDASEEPGKNKTIIGVDDKNKLTIFSWAEGYNLLNGPDLSNWNIFIEEFKLTKWICVEDLLPKR